LGLFFSLGHELGGQLGLELHIDLDDPELGLPLSDRNLARQWLLSSRLHRVLNLLSRGALLQCPLCVYDLLDDVVVIFVVRLRPAWGFHR